MRLHRNLLGDYSPQLSLKNMHLDGFRRKLDFRMHWNTFSGLSRCSSSVWLCTITSSMYTKHWCGSRSRSTWFIMRWNEELFVINREFWPQDNFWSLKIYCCQLWRVKLMYNMSVSTSTIHQHCAISIMPFIDIQCVMGQTIGDLYCVTNIKFCIGRHCVISVMPWIEHYCVMWQNIGGLHCVINIMYWPTLCHFYWILRRPTLCCASDSPNIVMFWSRSTHVWKCGRKLLTHTDFGMWNNSNSLLFVVLITIVIVPMWLCEWNSLN